MKIEFFHRVGNDHHIMAMADFARGLERHGLHCALRAEIDGREADCDLAVMWGGRMLEIQERQRALGREFLIMECGFVGPRIAYGPRATADGFVSIGFNGLNGRADFMNTGMPGDRGARLLRYVSDHRQAVSHPVGDWLLLCGQVPGDAALHGVDIDGWYRAAVATLSRRFPGAPIVFRPHPLHHRLEPPGCVVNRGQDLEDALAGAAAVVTFNSNAGVDAVLAGRPTIACDPGSMVWRHVGQGLEAAPTVPLGRARRQWLNDIAYAQWTRDEIRAGLAWDHLRGGLAAAA